MNAGKLTLGNIAFLVSDYRLTKEPVLIRRPVLPHLKVDKNSLLERNLSSLNATDSSSFGNPTVVNSGGYVSRVLCARDAGKCQAENENLI